MHKQTQKRGPGSDVHDNALEENLDLGSQALKGRESINSGSRQRLITAFLLVTIAAGAAIYDVFRSSNHRVKRDNSTPSGTANSSSNSSNDTATNTTPQQAPDNSRQRLIDAICRDFPARCRDWYIRWEDYKTELYYLNGVPHVGIGHNLQGGERNNTCLSLLLAEGVRNGATIKGGVEWFNGLNQSKQLKLLCDICDRGVSHETVLALYEADKARTDTSLQERYDWYRALCRELGPQETPQDLIIRQNRRLGIMDIAYTTGLAGFHGFEELRGAMARGNYMRAALEVEDSNWFREDVGPRGPMVRDMILSGTFPNDQVERPAPQLRAAND